MNVIKLERGSYLHSKFLDLVVDEQVVEHESRWCTYDRLIIQVSYDDARDFSMYSNDCAGMSTQELEGYWITDKFFNDPDNEVFYQDIKELTKVDKVEEEVTETVTKWVPCSI